MYKPIDKDEVLKLVKAKGPLIPNHLKKDLNTDTILIGAILSQLVAEGKVKVSSVKIGGSPLYYAVGTEEKLVDFTKYLQEKDRRVAEMLKERKVMKDTDQDPLVRVCLRNIKDYAKPLEVSLKGNKEIYWKWYLVDTKEAEEMILKVVKPQKEKPVIKEEEKPAKKVEEKKDEPKEEKKQKKKKEEKQQPEKQEKLVSDEPVQRKALAKPSYLLDEEKDAFFNQVRKYLEEKEVTITDYTIVKKGEVDLYVVVPNKLGFQEYFCKAKNKKKVAETDLSSAYLQGQATKLPIIFLSPGELNKKAKEMLPTQFKGMVVKNIG